MNILKRIAVGLAFGFVITTFFLIASSTDKVVAYQVLAWCIASAIYGVSSVVYDIKSINTLCATLLHYVICLAVTGVNIYLFYREFLGGVIISFTVIYLVIYLVMWQCDRRSIGKINKKLNKC